MRPTTTRLAVLASALALSGCMSSAPQVSRGDTNGGSVVEVRREIGELIFSDEVLCLSASVYSAHTMLVLLGPDRVKTKPHTVWGFHGAENATTGQWAERGTRELAATYPPRLARWFWDNAAHLHGNEFARVSGAWMIANNFAGEC
jgi:hypothetical protein